MFHETFQEFVIFGHYGKFSNTTFFATSKKPGEMMQSSVFSDFSWNLSMTLLVNLKGQWALGNLCLTFGISSAGNLAMVAALFKSVMIAFLLYHFGTFDDQWTVNFLSLRWTSVVITLLL